MVWPQQFLRVIDGAAAVVIASRDAQMRPRSARGSLVRRKGLGDQLEILALPHLAAHVLPNLRDNGAIAVMVALTASHEAFQVKGRVLDISDAPPEDEAILRARHDEFLENGARLGISRRLIERVLFWPALKITMTAEQLFHQTPGPGAGERVRP
jgi:hypothetical protein